jgi:hypothetical protein
VDGKSTSHVFDAQPNQQWTARVRVANSAGSSPWSASVSTRSSSVTGDLIEGPFVTHVQGVPRLSWRIQPNTDSNSVSKFQVEWKAQTESRWNTYGNTVIKIRIPFKAYFSLLTLVGKDLIISIWEIYLLVEIMKLELRHWIREIPLHLLLHQYRSTLVVAVLHHVDLRITLQ